MAGMVRVLKQMNRMAVSLQRLWAQDLKSLPQIYSLVFLWEWTNLSGEMLLKVRLLAVLIIYVVIHI